MPASRSRRRAAGDRADEVLARDREQQRAAELVQHVQAAQHRDGLRRRLGEVRARVEEELLGVDAALERDLHPLAQERGDVGDDVVVEVGVLQALLRRGARVHDDQRRAGARADVGERRVAQAADVVDDRRARRDRRLGDRGLVGVDGDERAEPAATTRSTSGTTRSISSSTSTGGRFVIARLAADVDDVRAGGEQLAAPARPARRARRSARRR